MWSIRLCVFPRWCSSEFMWGVWKVMRLATPLIFSGFNWDGACTMLLPQVCVATRANAVTFHRMCVFVQVLVRNLFCNCMYVSAWSLEKVVKRCYRMCREQKQWAELQCYDSESILNTETNGWMTILEVGDQALLSHMWILIKLNSTSYLRRKTWRVFTVQTHLNFI
jgi:hypothetical protein